MSARHTKSTWVFTSLLALAFSLGCGSDSSPASMQLSASGKWYIMIPLNAQKTKVATYNFNLLEVDGRITGNSNITESNCTMARKTATITGIRTDPTISLTFVDDRQTQFNFSGRLEKSGSGSLQITGNVNGDVACAVISNMLGVAYQQ